MSRANSFEEHMKLLQTEMEAIEETGRRLRTLRMIAPVDDEFPKRDYDESVRFLIEANRSHLGEL